MSYQGFYLYLTLFRFRLYNQKVDYTFITSISLLRKETGYSTEEIYNLLRLLEKLKVIEITNKSRWDQLATKTNDGLLIDDHRTLVIEARDKPVTEKKYDEYRKKEIYKPVSEDDFYIYVDLTLMELYKQRGLNERYYGIYCLMKKLSNGNREGKSYMSINKMAEILGYGDNNLNHMVYEMHRKYVLYSKYIEGHKGSTRFDHYILFDMSRESAWLENFNRGIERNIKKWDKKKLAYEKKKAKSMTQKEEEITDLSDNEPDEDSFQVSEINYDDDMWYATQ